MALSNSGSNGSSSQNVKLAQDIHDEFLVCKICLEAYKTPKCLACLHTFCEVCIETHALSETAYKKYSDYRDFTCPLCRKRTQLPTGGVKKLPDNFLVTSLQDLVNRQRPASTYPFCDICRMLNRRHRDAQAKCIDCGKLLCRSCTDQHRDTRVTRNHSIIDVDTEKDIECKEHKEELVRFYCMPCETAICILCTVSDHKEHEISSFPEAVTRFKDDVAVSLDTCRSKLSQLEDRLALLGVTAANVEEAEQLIRDAAINFISDIRAREKSLLEDLHGMFNGSSSEELQKKKLELQSEVDSLRSTCSLAEIVLKGRDLELLMLKKQVQTKLKALATIDTRTLFLQRAIPRVEFIPGSVHLGVLHQIDDEEDEKLSKNDEGDFESVGTGSGTQQEKAVTGNSLGLSGRLSRGSVGDLMKRNSLTSSSTMPRSSSFNFDVTSSKNDDALNSDTLDVPGSPLRSHSFASADSSTQTARVTQRERGITAILLPDQRAKAVQVDPNDVEQAYIELDTNPSEDVNWLPSPSHLFNDDEEETPIDKSSQTDIVVTCDVAVNTRCRVVQRQSQSTSGGNASSAGPAPLPLAPTNSCSSDLSSGSPALGYPGMNGEISADL